jgi:hypothetical protein
MSFYYCPVHETLYTIGYCLTCGKPRTCEAQGGCPNPIQEWHEGKGLCLPHHYAARQYIGKEDL